jgi:L-ribulose-5-phosphate 4-epimerase
VTSGAGSPAIADAVARARAEVSGLHAELVANGLVAWTSGNISARVRIPATGGEGPSVPGAGADAYRPSGRDGPGGPAADLMVIKPSGIAYPDLTPDAMVVCDLAGQPATGQFRPSSDTATHAYIYRHLPGVGGVVHTHSAFATAWAARGEPIPCVITAMADEFGGEIPLAPFALIGGEEIGHAVVATLKGHRSPAVLLRSHGVFTIGSTPKEAVKAAVMCEDVARTVHLARAYGDPAPLAPDVVDKLYRRYQEQYGQR